MRTSKFIKPFEYEGRGFVFYQVYAKLFEIPYGAYYLLKQNKFTELQEKFPDVFSFFTSNNILVADNFSELQFLDLTIKRHNQSPNDRNYLSLTIAPTLNCNFMCPYCYEEENARQVSFMSKEVTDNTLRFIKHQLNGPNAGVSISWYGGEPLLAVHTIQYISQELKKVIGNRLSASITTNGFF